MLAYQDITLKELIDEALLRANAYKIGINISEEEIKFFANKSIRETIIKCLPYKLNAFVARLNVTHNSLIPRSYIRFIRCLLKGAEQEAYREARYADVREFYQLTYWYGKNKWVGAMNYTAIFTIWNNGYSLQFKCYPNTEHETGTPPQGFEYANENYSGYLDYHYLPETNYLNPNDVLPIPPEYQEYLIQSTVIKLIAKKLPEQQLKDLYNNLANERNKTYKLYQELKASKPKQLDKYIFEYEEILKQQIKEQNRLI